MKKTVNDWGIDFWIHLPLIVLLWLSPILISWKIILIGIALYYLQLIVFGDCIMSKKQFGTKKRSITFYWYYGSKIFPRLNMNKVKFCADWVFPYIILGIALIVQIIIDFKPLIY